MAEHGLLFREDRLAYRLRHLSRRPRLVVAVGVFFVTLLLPLPLRGEHRWLIAFDLAASVYLGAVWLMMLRSTVGGIKERAQLEDDRKWTVLLLGSASAIAVLVALALDLHKAKNLPPFSGRLHLALPT